MANVAQLIRRALLDSNLVKIDSTTSPLLTQVELLTWCKEGADKLEKILRDAYQDYGLLVMQSNDVAFRWAGQTYNPTALRLVSGTRIYTLPPDLIEIKYIRPITSGREGLKFAYLDSSRQSFKDMASDTNPPSNPIFFDVVGERSLLLANDVDTTTDIEIGYIARSAPFQMYTDGTISISQSSAAVTGASTEWVIDELHHNLELIVSGDATAPKVVSQTAGGTFVDPSRFYYRVDSITADGNLTLSAPWLPAGISGRGYMLATVPVTPQEHHHTISKWVQACAKAKVYGWDKLAEFAAPFYADLGEIKSDIASRQMNDPEFVESCFEEEGW